MERAAPGIQLVCIFAILLSSQLTHGQRHKLLLNEQRRVVVRDPASRATARIPRLPAPPTVKTGELPVWELSLDEAIRVALSNADAVRVLSGVGAASSGLTIYSPAISNPTIDQARAVFDPTVSATNNFLRNESASPSFDPLDPTNVILNGSRSDLYDFNLDVSKNMPGGANLGLGVATTRSRVQPGVVPLSPQSTSAVDLTLTQPLLQGRGVDVNAVPIVLAFIDTEQSYFRLKGALQTLVAGVVEGYWNLVQARVDLWVLRQQIQQAEFAYERAAAGREVGTTDVGEVAQTNASLANFRASVIAAESTVLDRVAALRGILGLPPSSDFTIVPTTPPTTESFEFDWQALLDLAEQRRPDLIELQLILEADQQRILQARNQAQPRLDAVALYRWNGLEGEIPVGGRVEAPGGSLTDWTLGVNFSVPLTLRAERARLRQNELLLANDRTNLRQSLLQVSHALAFTVRTLDQLYAQFIAFREARAAAAVNLELQLERFVAGQTDFLDVLTAINTWGSSVTSEALAVTRFNTTLASLELETGTILETHGVRLFEERYASIGPLGRWGKAREYAATIRPGENAPRYKDSGRPAEEAFDLRTPVDYQTTERLPPPEQQP